MDLLNEVRPLALGALMILGGLACSQASSSVEDLQEQARPRPAYTSLNLTVGNATGAPVVKQLFLDPGNPQFPRQWPVLVSNHKDNQSISLWRYDFIQPGVTDGSQWYATLLMRVDNSFTQQFVSFYGRAGAFPANPVTLDPATAFAGDVPEIAANKKPISCYLFVRQGAPVRLVDPPVVGFIAPYRSFSDTATVSINIPGLDFPVGGATLATGSNTSMVGTAEAITDLGVGPDGQPADGIGTAVTVVNAERVPTTTRVSPVTSEFDLLFAWQDPSFGVTLTHGYYADPSSAGGSFTTGELGTTGGGFFTTMRPGSPSPSEGINTLNWTILRSTTDSVWALGWSSDVTATTSISRGQSQDVLTERAIGSAVVSAQVRGYIAGLMDPSARATMFLGDQDRRVNGRTAVLLEGRSLPLVARQPRAVIPATFSQLIVGGRTLWFRENGTVSGADVLNSDQTLTDRYGTVLSFSAYLPIR